MKIEEVIVVEGKNDTLNLKRYFEVDTIETHGLGLSRETVEYIREINRTRGVIVFTDPDSAGENIRRKLNYEIPNLKNAFVLKEDARKSKKVGVEHACKKVLEEALNNLVTFVESRESLSYADFVDLGLTGRDNSSELRDRLIKRYHLGKCNGKTLFKRLNMLGLKKEDIWQELI